MKMPLVASLILYSSCFAVNAQESKKMMVTTPSFGDQSVVRQYSNLEQAANNKQWFTRHSSYPTQIVRVHGELNGERHCEDVLNEIDAFFTNKITYKQFLYNTIIFCGYNPKTEYAERFSIDSYFDPINDEAIAYLENYLQSHNGQDLLGTPFIMESANGLAISLNIDTGVLDEENEVTLLRYLHDNQSHYFASNYDMMNELVQDIYERFYSNDPDRILPFLNRWFYPSADKIYYYVLSHANYVELQPERLFLMEKEPKVFTSPLRVYFAHHCDSDGKKHCL